MASSSQSSCKLFQYGSTWIRADFHLHTRVDREFSYTGEDNFYLSSYIRALKEAGIRLGVISNHNKFNMEEFKALRKTARNEEIFFVPGVELSVNDGANGIHTIVVFSDEWIVNSQDYISQFLNVAFAGKIPSAYEHENSRCSLGLIETIKTLEGYHRDFFLVFAHVEEKSGLWNELDGGRIQELGRDEIFRRRALAFQKVRTHDTPNKKCRVKVQDWLGDQYPAEIEGSDCKTIEQIGKGKAVYLKIGDFTFEAVKYSLLDHVNRIAVEPRKHERSYIRSVSFDGGVLDGKTIYFSPELNQKLIDSFNRIKEILLDGKKTLVELQEKAKEFEKLKDGLKEKFAEIERKLAEELKETGAKAIRPDEFRQLKVTVDQAKQMLETFAKQETQRILLEQILIQDLARLNELWREEYKAIKDELNNVNIRHSSLNIKVEFKADKDAFINFMKDIFRGSRIRESTFTSLTNQFSDFGAMYKDFDKAKTNVGGTVQLLFEEYFHENLPALLTWQVPNRFIIEYRDKELKHHSLGQRASALILFVLSQQENDLIIIDQPEDDLDNQTIYEDVIKLICSLKPKTQFIFATHNANFPVLGDAEQIVSCAYTDDNINVLSGSIDCPELQQEVVDIMEGGEEAFRQRRRIYEIWKPRNF